MTVTLGILALLEAKAGTGEQLAASLKAARHRHLVRVQDQRHQLRHLRHLRHRRRPHRAHQRPDTGRARPGVRRPAGPRAGHPARQRPSRQVRDQPPVQLVLQVRLFICDNPACVVATFAGQVNGLTASRTSFRAGRPLVLKDVSYAAVSAYMAVSPGSVHDRDAGRPECMRCPDRPAPGCARRSGRWRRRMWADPAAGMHARLLRRHRPA